MRTSRLITAVDSHTEGEPARIVTGGIPHIPGKTMFDKMVWAQQHLDSVRTMLMFEPRGHGSMAGSIITAPCSADADLGVLHMETTGFTPMCGHATIAVCTVLVETGMVAVEEPVTTITLDAPAGLVTATVRVEDGIAKDVTFRNVPSFLYARDVEVNVPTLGRVRLDIVWGGDFYAIVSAQSVGLEVIPSRTRDLMDCGRKIRAAIREQVEIAHPENPRINSCTQVRFTDEPSNPQAASKNVVFFGAEGGAGGLDRSPCGTGTSAEMAARFARGLLGLHEQFVCESIVGSLFYGEIVEQTHVGPFPAVIPTVRGSAYITGIQQFVLDPRDPWPSGFQLE